MDFATWVAVGSIVTSSVVAIAAVWLASSFADRQAHIGRVWERRATAYSEILEALHDIEEWYRLEMKDESSRRDVSEDIQAARHADYQDAHKRLGRRIAREVWLLPETVKQRVAKMDAGMYLHQDSWFDYLDNGSFEVKKAVSDISRLAQDQLSDPRNFFFRSL